MAAAMLLVLSTAGRYGIFRDDYYYPDVCRPSPSAARPRRMQATRVEATDRVRLEQLCRYVIRPPLAAGRLQILDQEPVAFDLKSIWSDGTYQIVLAREAGRPGAAAAAQSGALSWRAGALCRRPGADRAGAETSRAGDRRRRQ